MPIRPFFHVALAVALLGCAVLGGCSSSDSASSSQTDSSIADQGPAIDAAGPDASIAGDGGACRQPTDCDDGQACTANDCVDGRCVTRPASDCPWPAEPFSQADNLTAIEGPGTNEFHYDLSGATYNPVTRTLWLCRDTNKVWAVADDGQGGYTIAEKNGQRAEWTIVADLEGVALASYDEPETVYLVVEGLDRIREYDLSTYGTATLKNEWDTRPFMAAHGGNLGAEGITFVPDVHLAAQGFVDGRGQPYVSKNGMGGLMLLGHQSGGGVYAFDLDRQSGKFDFVGAYRTAGYETAGLELDRDSGLLYIWHGEDLNKLEVARLSSRVVDSARTLDAIKVYQGPGSGQPGSNNHEGIALTPSAGCADGKRDFFLTTDGGGIWSLTRFAQFPCSD